MEPASDAHLDGHVVSDPRRVRRHGDAADQDPAGAEAARRGRGGGLPAGAAALAGGDAAVGVRGDAVYEVPAWAWASGRGPAADRPRAAVRPGPRPALRRGDAGATSPAGATAGRWSTRSTRCWATRSSATAWAAGWSSGPTGRWSSGVLRHAAAVIALGEPVKEVVVEEKGVPADRVSVIYPGIDLARVRRARPRRRRSPASAPSTRSSCTSAASSIPTRGCRS